MQYIKASYATINAKTEHIRLQIIIFCTLNGRAYYLFIVSVYHVWH